MSKLPVLIVGAGPTGLNLSLALAKRNVLHRIISDADGPGTNSRAMVVQARTLEFYDQFGFADEVADRGVIAEKAHMREGGDTGRGREVQTFSFKDLGGGLSPYPFVLAFPQDDHERFLVSKVKEAGVEIEWGVKLTSFDQQADAIVAILDRDNGTTENVEASYICGCDGARSRVRESLGIGFPGGTYEQLFYVADVKISRGFERDFYFNLGAHILSLMLPVRSSGMQRLIGLVPPELSDGRNLTFEDIRSHIEPLVDVKVTEVNWFSTYRVHHRVADKFRIGRAFLAGDAGHIHSPAGGQGMNTGIGDAINLGWKLANVIQLRADQSLLDSYEPERIGFARSLVATTDRGFTGMVSPGLPGELARKVIAPLLFSVATRFSLSRHAIFRTVSQTRIHYPDSPISQGVAGHVHGGDRLPWTGSHDENNFLPLRSLDWQLHVYGDADEDLQAACRDINLPLNLFPWSDGASEAGFKRDAFYLVRPDGYVALASPQQDIQELRSYIGRLDLRFP